MASLEADVWGSEYCAVCWEGAVCCTPCCWEENHHSVLFQVINSMFLRKYVCLSVSVKDGNFSNQDMHKPKFTNSPFYTSFFFIWCSLFVMVQPRTNPCFKVWVTTGSSPNRLLAPVAAQVFTNTFRHHIQTDPLSSKFLPLCSHFLIAALTLVLC